MYLSGQSLRVPASFQLASPQYSPQLTFILLFLTSGKQVILPDGVHDYLDDFPTYIRQRHFSRISDVIRASTAHSTVCHFGMVHCKSISGYLNHVNQVLFSFVLFCLCCARLNFTTKDLKVYGRLLLCCSALKSSQVPGQIRLL